MSSTWAKVGSDQLMNLTGGTSLPYVYHISSIESPVDLFQLFLVELALAERDSKNAGISFFFFCQWDLVCRPLVPSGDRGNWG